MRLHNAYNPGHNILTIFNVYQIFFSPQVKRGVIISNKHLISQDAKRLKKLEISEIRKHQEYL